MMSQDTVFLLIKMPDKKDSQPIGDKVLNANKQAATCPPKNDRKSGNSKKYRCPVCQQELSSRQSMSRHKKIKHPGKVEKKVCSLVCNQCKTFRGERIKDLLHHQNDSHGKRFQVCNVDMDTDAEFTKWKHDLEMNTNCLYVKPAGDKLGVTHTTTYYHCNRSGFFASKGSGKRALKSQGSSKIQANCCAFITKKVEKDTGKVCVEYCNNHTHETEYSHLRISDETRKFIVDKLTSGVDSRELLVEIKENASNERDSMIKHRDILNIKHQFDIAEPVRDNSEFCQASVVDLGIDTAVDDDDDDDDDDEDDVGLSSSHKYKKNLCDCESSNKMSHDLNQAKTAALKKVSMLSKILKSAPNIEVVDAMMPYINAAIRVGEGLSIQGANHDRQKNHSIQSSQNFGSQVTFQSTAKKKRKKHKDSKLPSKKVKKDISAHQLQQAVDSIQLNY